MLKNPFFVFFLFFIANFIFFLPFIAYCQPARPSGGLPTANFKIDSLFTLLKKDKDDTNKVVHLNRLCWEYKNISSYDTAIHYGNAALKLAKQLDFTKEIARAYNNFGLIYNAQGSYDTALENYFSSLKIRKETGDKQGIAASYNNIGLVYFNQSKYANALENHFASLKIRKETGDKQGIATSYNSIGIIYWNQGNYAKALENFFISLKIREEIGNKRDIGDSYNNIGLVYGNQGNYDKALENHFVSFKIKEEIGDKKGIADSYNNIGIIYSEQGMLRFTPLQQRAKLLDKALGNHFASLKIKKEISDKKGITDSYNNIGTTYFEQGNLSLQRGNTSQAGVDYDKALENHFASLKICEEIGDQESIATSYINIGNTYIAKNNYAEAITYLLNSLRLFKEMSVKDGTMEAYQKLSELSEKMNDYRNAYKYHQLYSQIKDSIFNEESSKQIADMQTKYETEKKDKELQFQELKISEQELLLNSNRTLLFIIIISSMLLIAFGWTAFSRYRIKQQVQLKSEILRQQELRTNAIIETQEQERKRIAQDLHDGIGHKLTTLKINFEKITEDIRTVSPEQKIIVEQTENILDETHKEVRTLSHRMMPKALQEREFADAVSDLLEQTLANSKIKYQLKNDLPVGLPDNVQVCLYRVLQELLNNILKHAEATEIAVQIFKNKDMVIMMVEDDGKGIQEKNNATNGIGLHNIAGRIHTLKGVFTIEPGPVKGTIATVRIPV